MEPGEAVIQYVTTADLISASSLGAFVFLAMVESDSDLQTIKKFVWAHIVAWLPISVVYKAALLIGINGVVDNIFEAVAILSLIGPFMLNWMGIIDYTLAMKDKTIGGLTAQLVFLALIGETILMMIFQAHVLPIFI